MAHPLVGALRQGLLGLDLSLDATAQARLLDYMDLIAKWNKVYNLTAVRDTQEMLTHHVLDSLAVVAPLRRELAKLQRAEDAPAALGFVRHHALTCSRKCAALPFARCRRGCRPAGRGDRHHLPRGVGDLC